MSEDYRSMWADLGLGLAAHDALLGVLGQAYQDIYLAQKNPCMVAFLVEKLEREVLIPEDPQFIGALGAALLASELEKP